MHPLEGKDRVTYNQMETDSERGFFGSMERVTMMAQNRPVHQAAMWIPTV